MSNLILDTNILSYPFYIYDSKKYHGFIYTPVDRLYHPCHKHNIRKYLPKGYEIPQIIIEDLRSMMDIASDKIPINPDLILIPSTMKYRKRTSTDFFTYSLQPPTYNLQFNIYMTHLIPRDYDRSLLHRFLMLALTSNISSLKNNQPSTNSQSHVSCHIPAKCYIIVHGDNISVNALFSILLKLDPIIKQGRISLYCESNVNKTTLDEIHQSRIVLCDIGHRTLRIANPPYDKMYQRPIQYHGIVYQDKHINIPSKEVMERTVTLASVNNDITFTPGDVLGWILPSK